MSDYRISKDSKVDSLATRRENRLPLVPVDPTISTSPELGSIVFDPTQLRPYFGTGSAWVSLITLTDLAAGTGLTYTIAGGVGTFALADTAVTPGTYGTDVAVSQITVDQQGRLTSAVDVPISFPPSALQSWSYYYTNAIGVGYGPSVPLPIWDTQEVGAAGQMSGATIWTAVEAGTYRIDTTVATSDIINPNTATLVYELAANPGVPIPIGANHTPPQLAFMDIQYILNLGVGDRVYVTSGDLGCITAGVAPTQGRTCVLLITKLA